MSTRLPIYVVWYPTFRCQLACAYCHSHGFPVVRHGAERTASEWADVWAACPAPWRGLNVCGGEPSLFPLAEALAGVAADLHVNSNLVRPPDEWLPALADRVTGLTASLQYHRDHPGARRYWRHLADARRIVPRAYVSAARVTQPQVDTADAGREFCARAAALGCHPHWHAYNDSHLWRDWTWRRTGTATSCSGGRDMLAVLPDGTAFRCLGHAAAGLHPIGNLFSDGWAPLATEPQPCADCLCTLFGLCDKVSTTFAAGEPGGWAVSKPGGMQA